MVSLLLEYQYIGTCSYWSMLLQANKIVLDPEEHYVKKSYRNRAHILGANGLLRLSIPLQRGKQHHTKMKDVRISYHERWQDLHWQSLTSAYRRSPFFEYYEDYFKRFYIEQFDSLIDYNFQIIQTIVKLLKLELTISFAEKYHTKDTFNGTDCRSLILPGKDFDIIFRPYHQVFSDRFSFEPDLCVLDLLFNLGSSAKEYLQIHSVKL